MTYKKYVNEKIEENCPYFAIGCCKKDDSNPCPYRYHTTCKYNYLCNNPECKYGHGISVEKREIIYYIDEEKCRDDYFSANVVDKCKMSMNCVNKDCKLEHRYDYEDRKFIYMIADNTMNDKTAWDEYYSKYCNEKSRSDTSLSNSSTICPVCPSTTISPNSSMNCFSSPKPLTNSYASVLKNKKEENIEITDDTVKILDDLDELNKTIREIDINKVYKNDIELKIKKLKEELEQVEIKINNGKDQMKNLLSKLSDQT